MIKLIVEFILNENVIEHDLIKTWKLLQFSHNLIITASKAYSSKGTFFMTVFFFFFGHIMHKGKHISHFY